MALLVWTTTPWTLVSNTAVAVKPGAAYAVVRTAEDETLVVAEELVPALFGDTATVLETMPGTALERLHYQRPFDYVEIPDAHYVILADYVTTDDGSGLVHQAPAFGADDLVTCRAYGLPVVNPVRPDGHFADDVPVVGGMFFKKADETLVADLEQRGLMFRHVPYEHAYPHCWRCHTPLIYYAQPSWYIRTTAIKDELLAQNEQTNWFPGTIKWGRYGDWLTNNVDWALSRNRYWGTPLPIWRCPEGHLVAVGSLAELSELAGHDVTGTDPHRPYVDDITVPCARVRGRGHGACPRSSTAGTTRARCRSRPSGTRTSNEDAFAGQYPADFICEAIDQTRGWFYTLMAVGTLVFGESSYRNVVCLGHILDEDGRKMSKHLGNILAPMPLMDEHGADALRWFMLASGSPWQARRVGHSAIADVVRKTLLTYWNTVSFQSLYARTAGWSPADGAPAPADRPVIDRWVLSEAQTLARGVDEALEAFDTQRAGRLLSTFVDDLSNWYVRRSRRRFWEGDPAALATLHEALRVVTLCLAPFTPFITERVWQDLFRATDPARPRLGPPRVLARAGPDPGGPRSRRPDGAGAPARRARPGRTGDLVGPHPPAAAARAHLRPGLGRPAGRPARPGRRGAERPAPGGPGRRERRTGGRLGQGELPCPRPALRQADTVGRVGHRRRARSRRGPRAASVRHRAPGRAGPRGRRGHRCRRRRDRDAAGGLGRRHRGRREPRARPAHRRRAAPGGPRPRGRAHAPGGSQGRRARRVRPDQRVVGIDGRRAVRRHRRACRVHRRRGPGDVVQRRADCRRTRWRWQTDLPVSLALLAQA